MNNKETKRYNFSWVWWRREDATAPGYGAGFYRHVGEHSHKQGRLRESRVDMTMSHVSRSGRGRIGESRRTKRSHQKTPKKVDENDQVTKMVG